MTLTRTTPRIALGTAIALALAACSMAPRYERPIAPVAGTFPFAGETLEEGAGAVGGAADRLAPDIGWREFLGDPRLGRLVELALVNNRDLQLAVLNVEAARAQFQIQRADQFPTLGLSAQGTRQRIPGGVAVSPGVPATGGGVFEQYTVGLGLSAFELDLFGRVRSLRDAALREYLSTVEARRSAQISLVASVATAYLNERAADERLAIVEASQETWEESYRLAQLRFDAGVGSELDLREAQTLIATARADLAAARREAAQAHNTLVLLVGQPLPEEDLPPALPLGEQELLADIPAGLPSDLIERRPDILAAEQSLRGANASIGAARAAFFPTISLTGSLGSTSTDLDNLFDSGTRSWSFTPQITLPIFDTGRNLAGLDLAWVRRNIAVVQYEQTIQTAFREVADGLAARATLDEELDAQNALVEASQRRFELSQLRYEAGVDSSIQLLDAQRSLYNAQQAQLQTRLLRLTSLVDLYRALGGGWQPADEATAAEVASAPAADPEPSTP
ncbi:efflux transporter outer membrane subunit [Coralloluteibacterium stylophorae]|uniref:Efflux transporter outer membrane subunit n=1 Tax=Coralloluteibacterium stylophorae TaxID=1776034 RepID=A0A8J8AY85_9GAMM|nr:efflux transporter outer membrane subunit [Coralloluteibacterium stylophorae]MBS7457566.1 efflux transporter outer membrane subunit [Coralloluteibacterium stylophorae]